MPNTTQRLSGHALLLATRRMNEKRILVDLAHINREGFFDAIAAHYILNLGTEEQKQAVLARDLNWCIRLGGNIYFLAKIGATDGKSFQQMAGSMTGMTEEEYRNMMINGGRSAEGNRYVGEDGDAQAHRQPQGKAGQAQKD